MKKFAKRAWAGLKAAFTTPEAVKAEKSFAVFAITRIVIAVGGTASTAALVVEALKAAGVL